MAITKITELNALTLPVTGDFLVIVDVSDTSMNAAGTDKKMTYGSLVTALETSLTIANITGNLPVTKLDSGNNATSARLWRGDGTWANSITNFALTTPTLTTPSIASPTFTTAVNFGANTVSFTETDNGNSSTADTINWTTSNKQKSTLTGNVTYTFTAPASPCNLVLKILTGAGGFTATWPATVKWSGGTAPTITTTASRLDIITFYYDGTNYYGSFIQNFTP